MEINIETDQASRENRAAVKAITFAALLWIPVLIFAPTLLFLLAVLFLYREIVSLSAKIFQKELDHVVSGLDNTFSADDFWTNPKGANSFILFTKDEIDFQLVQRRFTNVLESHPSGYQKLMTLYPTVYKGYSFWKYCDAPFNIENHFVLKLFEKHEVITERVFNAFICDWTKSRFRFSCPLWEILIIPSLQMAVKENKVINQGVLCFKSHHMLGDGYSKLKLLEKVFDLSEILEHGTVSNEYSVQVGTFMQNI